MGNLFDKKLLKFILVGIVNTLFGAGIMFLLQDMAHFGYWGSSAVANILGAVLSFFLNKSFTFQNKDSLKKNSPALCADHCGMLPHRLRPCKTADVSGSFQHCTERGSRGEAVAAGGNVPVHGT